MSDELDETRAFVGGLNPPAKQGAAPPTQGGRQIDPDAAHVAASFAELRQSTRLLHADLTQRIRSLEAKVDAGLPDWKLLAQAITRAGEEAGRKATADLVASNRVLMEEGRLLNERRAQDRAYLWTMVKWVGLPIAVVGLSLIAWGVYDAGKLPPRWMLLVAYGLGVGSVILGVQTVEWLDAKLRQRTWWRRR